VTTISATRLAASASSAAGAGALAAEGGEDRFLKLLVAQMRNQDPLNPLDNAEVTSQLAQISTVTGIERLNQSIAALAAGMGDTQALQAAALVGRDVLVGGNATTLAGGSAVGGFELTQPADRVTVEIRDAAGLVVHRAELGVQEAGVHGFAWDGMTDAGAAAAPGRYTFSVAARRDGAAVESAALAAARVLAVTRDAAGVRLELQGLGSRPYTEVRQIL
jgi:flagellar basal-body rod modification protein FlgD